MSRTAIDVNDRLLADAARALGTGTPEGTVTAALREVLEIRRGAPPPARLRAAAEEDASDLDFLKGLP